MKRFLVLFVFCTTLVFGQAPAPYVSGGLNLMPPGYASTAWSAGGGLEFNRPHVVLDSYFGYDTGKKDNDGTSPDGSGHDISARGFAGYKHGQNYFGVGARWSRLTTDNYSKSGSAHPEVGLGRDWNFARGQLAYMFRPYHEYTSYSTGQVCDGCGSGSQGADISLWLPSPAHSRHLFARVNMVLFEFHDSFTDPTNIALTKAQAANKHFGDLTEFQVGWRF